MIPLSVARARRPMPVLFLVADTGGGHRSAANAVTEALAEAYSGEIDPICCDPLGGPESPAILRWVTGLYGPAIRLAPRVWGAIYRATDSPAAMRLVHRTLLALAERPTKEAVARHQPAAVVSFHPLLTATAVKASDGRPVVTVVTDLVTTHVAWRYAGVDRVLVPTAAVRWRFHLDGVEAPRCVETGLPVAKSSGPPTQSERAALRRRLGVGERRLLIVLTGGGEGSGGIARRAAALLRWLDDIEVVVICGRNRRLERTLARRAGDRRPERARTAAKRPERPTRQNAGNRLIVKGFVDNMADWLRCADVVVTKAGPGTIAEATCAGAPLVLIEHLRGQEDGNVELVVGAGAGREAASVGALVRQIDELRHDPAALGAMRAASARLGRPDAASRVAAELAELVGLATRAADANDG